MEPAANMAIEIGVRSAISRSIRPKIRPAIASGVISVAPGRSEGTLRPLGGPRTK
jgi:hypothetical protein